MPDTSLGIVYPDEGGNVNLWTHFEVLAGNVNDLLLEVRERAYLIGPSVSTDYAATWTDVLSVSVDCTAGHIYEVIGHTFGTQVTTTGSAQSRLLADGVQTKPIAYENSQAAGLAVQGHGVLRYVATLDGPVDFKVQAMSSAGAYRIGINGASLWVKGVLPDLTA